VDGEMRKQLLAALEILDEGGYRSHLSKAFLSFRTPSRPILSIRDAMKELIYLHFLGLQNHVRSEDMLEKFLADFQMIWDASTSLAQIEHALSALLCGHLADINRERDEMEMRPIRLAKKYMQEHYRKNITLEDVAAVAGFHPAYFSTVFKKVTGENFLEYLSALRMKEAKELLSDAGLRIPDVAEQVGYLDSKYFVKLFKKATGLTPQEYRKLYY
jgi:two-component system response regulator YesN